MKHIPYSNILSNVLPSKKRIGKHMANAFYYAPISAEKKLNLYRRISDFGAVERKNNRVDSETTRRCWEYAGDVLGDERYAVELARYCAIYGRWKEGWIPETFFQRELVSRNTSLSTLSRQKTLSNYFLCDDSLPDLAYFSNLKFFTREWDPIPEEDLCDFLFQGRDRIVFKQNSSMRGRGVTTFDKQSFKPQDVMHLGDGCFQTHIRVHPSTPRFGVDAVGTLRVVTSIEDSGDVRTRFCNLRVGRANQSHIISDDSVRISVCVDSGKLRSCGYLTDWTPVSAHPDTGEDFDGSVYPDLSRGIDLCRRLHKKIPSFWSIGWDICLDANNDFKVMEWNQLFGVKVAESMNGPNFADLKLERRGTKIVPFSRHITG